MRKNQGGVLVSLLVLTTLTVPMTTNAEQRAEVISLHASVANTTYEYEDHTSTSTKALAGDIIELNLTAQNPTDKQLTDATLQVAAPKEVTFLNDKGATTMSLEPGTSKTFKQEVRIDKPQDDQSTSEIHWTLTHSDTRVFSNNISIIHSRPSATINAEQRSITNSHQQTVTITNTGTASIVHPTITIAVESPATITSASSQKLPPNTRRISGKHETIFEGEERIIPITLHTDKESNTVPNVVVHLEYTDIQNNVYKQHISAAQEQRQGAVLGETDTKTGEQHSNKDADSNDDQREQEESEESTTTASAQSNIADNAESAEQPTSKQGKLSFLYFIIPALLGFIVAIAIVIIRHLKDYKKIEEHRKKYERLLEHTSQYEIPPPPTAATMRPEEQPTPPPPTSNQ